MRANKNVQKMADKLWTSWRRKISSKICNKNRPSRLLWLGDDTFDLNFLAFPTPRPM